MFTMEQFDAAMKLIRQTMPETPQYMWPGLAKQLGTEVWVKHENHTPIGAFKIRGGLTYFNEKLAKISSAGVISATRGNHGQSIAMAARQFGIRARLCVPQGNSVEKNTAMKNFGGEVIIHGQDFEMACEHALTIARDEDVYMVPSFDPFLVLGVGTYGIELLSAQPDLDCIYVPIGMGSGICGLIAARDALGLKTRIIGVNTETAQPYALSFKSKKLLSVNVSHTIADGMAVRIPHPQVLEIILKGAEDVVTVKDDEIKQAMRDIFSLTHNVAEGAGAAAYAALLKNSQRLKGQKTAFILSGGNVDRDIFALTLMGELSHGD